MTIISTPDADVCVFCGILDEDDSAAPPYDRVIAEHGSLVLIAALGPLVDGHALIVSRSHSEGMLYEAPGLATEFREFGTQLRNYCGLRGTELIEIEHGTNAGNASGPCIRHSHVHLLPTAELRWSQFQGILPDLETVSPAKPYVWISDGRAEALHDATDLPAQGLRRELGRALHRDDWDWAVSPNLAGVESTQCFWDGFVRV